MWIKKTIQGGDLAKYSAEYNDASLSSRVKALYTQQKRVWAEFRHGHEAMKKALTMRVELGNCWVLCRYTPHRMASVSARVDPLSIARRPCFLCPENLYPREKGLPYGEDYFVLCNISPIFDFHLVITHRHHIPQQIQGHFDLALTLTRDLSPQFVLIYNGARCGASAPDHLHFQAFPSQNLPLEAQLLEARNSSLREIVVKREDILVAAPMGFSRHFVTFRSNNATLLSSWVHQTLEALGEAEGSAAEPMINLVMVYKEDGWEVILFPRSKHRPRCYDDGQDGQLVISPGAIDMAGVFVIPRKKDYERVNAETLNGIYQEVTLPEDRFSRLIEKLREKK